MQTMLEFLLSKGLKPKRKLNNIWIEHPANSISKPTILLNSHLDTVKPSGDWKFNPFKPYIDADRIYGLGSNDAGASLVSLLAAFMNLYKSQLSYNLIFSATAEEEISGRNGLESILEEMGTLELAIVGEPTKMELAVAERGLVVLDCTINGRAGHAAREEGENPIYKALPVLEWFRNLEFPRESDYLGKVKITVTQVSAGNQHNMVPDNCAFVVDIRNNGMYTNNEIVQYIIEHAACLVNARSLRLNSSTIDPNHPVVKVAKNLGIPRYGSPTTSDQAIIPWPSVKIGPGDSARSHTANEYIRSDEIENGIQTYVKLLRNLDMEYSKQ